jgi:uncharacterized membrane protein YeaQ/YmgE (transglycosylase-associated protein family)
MHASIFRVCTAPPVITHTVSEEQMTITGFLILLVIAAIAGSLGQAIAGYSLGGCLVSVIVGFVGAFIGMWVAGQFGLPELFPVTIQGETFPVMWSIIGSAILSLVLGLLTHRREVI